MKTCLMLLSALLSACATIGETQPTPSSPGSARQATAEHTGRSKANPYLACGAGTSYFLVASVFRCSDGANPFHGDLRAAAGARRGSIGPHQVNADGDIFNSHIVDQYSVPCPSGPEQIFVCMYHCEDGKSPLGR